MPPARETYLPAGGSPIFAVLHPASSQPVPDAGPSLTETAVLLCPPFGWEELCSYRSLREWAQQLAARGCPALRIDLPGSGESAGSPRDPGRLDAWTEAVAQGAHSLVQAASRPVTAIGIGLGGMLACRAAAGGAPIGDLVLWGVSARGRTALRELALFARLNAPEIDQASEPSEQPDGSLEVGGFVLSAETRDVLGGLDLTELDSLGAGRRALLLDRDGIAVDQRLAGHLEQTGAAVTVAPGAGWNLMMAEPHRGAPPTATFERVAAWLDAPRQPASPAPAGADGAEPATALSDPGAPTSLELVFDGAGIRETAIAVERPFGQLRAVLAEPASGPPGGVCAVFLNAGAMRRIGPNRMWVEASRRWAARGVPSLRLDLKGIGDSDGDARPYYEIGLNAPELVDEIPPVLDALEARGLPSHFVLVGLCSGAFQAFHAGLRDRRTRVALMLNASVLFWHDALPALRDARKLRRLAHPSSWLALVRGRVRARRMGEIARSALLLVTRLVGNRRAQRTARTDVVDALDRLRESRTRVVLAFSGNENLHHELEREGVLDQLDRWPNLELEQLAEAVHTLRPLAAQRSAHELMDRVIDVELGAGEGAPAVAVSPRRSAPAPRG